MRHLPGEEAIGGALLEQLQSWVERELGVTIPEAREAKRDVTVTAIVPSHRRSPIGRLSLADQTQAVHLLALQNGPVEIEANEVMKCEWRGHGATRQGAIPLVKSDYTLLTVDDALPIGRGCVAELIHALEEGDDEGPWDAVYARQLPWPSSDPITRTNLERWTPPGKTPTRAKQVDNVFALYRTETLRRHPLPDVPTGEDLHWSRGRRVAYVPTALVMHAHRRRPIELFERTRSIHREHVRLGDPPLVPSTLALLRALPGVIRPTLKGGPRELPNQIAELLGQWAARRG